MVTQALPRDAAIESEVYRLATRLARLDDASASARRDSRWLRASLRLQLAGLRDRSPGDPAAAADTLMLALGELGPIPAIAEPLYDLHRRTGRPGAARLLCTEAARAARHPGLRALWQARLGDVCAESGDDEAAVRAYRTALADAPAASPIVVTRCVAALGRLGRDAERVTLLAERARRAACHEELVCRRELAALCAGPLSRPEEAAAHAKRARSLVLAIACNDESETSREGASQPEHANVTASITARFDEATDQNPLGTGEARALAAAAARELDAIPGRDDLLDARRVALHAMLARLHGGALDDPDRALEHARRAFEHRAGAPADSKSLERAYLDALRRAGAVLELEQILAAAELHSLDRGERTRSLARLRAGALRDAVGAAEAWRICLDENAHDLEALRGLRDASRLLADWPTVAWTLEEEACLPASKGGPASPAARTRLLIALGEVSRDGLGSTTRAARAFASALETDPGARPALHALQGVLGSMDDWKGVLELVLSEIDQEPASNVGPRIRLLVRAARIAAELLDDDGHARESLRAALALGPLGRDGEELALELGMADELAARTPAPLASPLPWPTERERDDGSAQDASRPIDPNESSSSIAQQPRCTAASAGQRGALASEHVNDTGPFDRVRALVARGAWAEARAELEAWIAAPEGATNAHWISACDGLAALLAGPLDAPRLAARALEQAIARKPDDVRLRARLADLLTRIPERQEEAIRRHRELLAHQPTRQSSIEALHGLAVRRGAVNAESDALATLHALGLAADGSTCERIATAIDVGHGLEHPVWERVRRSLVEVRGPLARVLDTPDAAPRPLPGDVRARFREWSLRIEGELAAPALVPLDDPTLESVVRLIADLAFDRECVSGEGRLVNRLARELSWRTRRRLRKILSPFTADEIADVDIPAWRRELRGIAHAEALGRTGGDLRAALVALTEDDGTLAIRAFGAPDLPEAVRGSPAASALLRRVCLAWSGSL